MAVRLGRRLALVLGWWGMPTGLTESEALSAAGVRYLEADLTEIKGWDNGLPEKGEDGGRTDGNGEADSHVAGWRVSCLDRAEHLPDRPIAL